MSTARTLIWTPTSTADVQLALHRAGAGPAVVVPVPSGTVLLPRQGRMWWQVGLVVQQCRRLSGRVLLVSWNDIGAAVYMPPGSWSFGDTAALLGQVIGRYAAGMRRIGVLLRPRLRENAARQQRMVDRLAEVTGGDATALTEVVRDFRAGGPQQVERLFRAAGRDDVAQVTGLVDSGQADPWLARLPATTKWSAPWFLAIMLAFLVAGFLTGWPLVGAVVGALLAWGYFAVCQLAVRRKPINTVLPVIPVTQGAAPTD